jgi:two-component system KDP operon response regulator KdpE
MPDKPACSASVLVADDDPAVRRLIRGILTDAGYRVTEAEDGRQAVRLLAEGHYDLLLLDIVMPEQEGLETIGFVRRRYRDLKIIAMPGFTENYLKMAMLLGAGDAIAKPIRVETLLAAVRRALSGRV